MHSSQFNGPEPNAKGKKAVVVGCCNSGHDIARDYYEHGYDVTMVQRSSTLVLTCESLLDVTMKGLYSEDGVRILYALLLTLLWLQSLTEIKGRLTVSLNLQPPTEDADLINYSFPNAVAKISQIQATREMLRRDAKLLNGLTAAGFALDSGPDESGLWMKYLSRGGGYYIGTSSVFPCFAKQPSPIPSIKAHSPLTALPKPRRRNILPHRLRRHQNRPRLPSLPPHPAQPCPPRRPRAARRRDRLRDRLQEYARLRTESVWRRSGGSSR